MSDLAQGSVAWAWLDPTVGREQVGRRPVVVVSSAGYLDVVTTLVVVVPVTQVDRGWPNHVALSGQTGDVAGYAVTEQPRTIGRDRLADTAGRVDEDCLHQIKQWLGDFLDL